MRNVRDYGAAGDGLTSDTAAVQRAIDAGGEVFFPPGTYKSGTLYLRSHGGLTLEPGAVIVSGGDEEQWNDPHFCPQNRTSVNEKNNGRHLIVAYQCEDVFIRGGKIDGRCLNWFDEMNDHNPLFKLKERNGQMLFFCESRDIRIENCDLCNASYWHCFLHGCEHVLISGLRIRGDIRVPCNDGIDVDCCRFVMVRNCEIETGDDAFTLRGNNAALGQELRPCEFINVSNSMFSSCYGDAVRLGVGNGLIRNCSFSDIMVPRSNIGIELASSYSGESGVTMENISFENIRLNVCRPFKILLEAENCHRQIFTHIRNIDFSHIRGRGELSSEIFGNTTGEISGLRFKDVRFDYYGKGPAPNVDEQGYWCKESTAAAFTIRNVQEVTFDDLTVNWCQNQDLWLYEVEAENSAVHFKNCSLEKGFNEISSPVCGRVSDEINEKQAR